MSRSGTHIPFGIAALLLAYVLLNVPLLRGKPATLEQLGAVSFDEPGVCWTAGEQIKQGSFTSAGQGHTMSEGVGLLCNPFPYGQLYPILIAAPLMLAQHALPITESVIIRWAVGILVLSGLVTLYMTYKCAARLYAPVYGLLATGLLLITSEFLRWSNEIHPDMPQLACMMAGFYFTIRLYDNRLSPLPRGTTGGYSIFRPPPVPLLGKEGEPHALEEVHGQEPLAPDGKSSSSKTFAYAGLASFFAGMAMAAKFNGIFLLPMILVAYNRLFLHMPGGFRLGAFLARNLTYGLWSLAVFVGAFALFDPCLMVHRELLIEPLTRTTGYSLGHAPLTLLTPNRLDNFLHFNYVLADSTIGYGMYALCVAAGVWALIQLVRRPRAELATPRILAELFAALFLSYSLILGYGLYEGRLLKGYERYVLPAVPILYISAMRVLHAIAQRRTRWARRTATAVALVVLAAQAGLIANTVDRYRSIYQLHETGFFKIYDWVREYIPPGSTIYTEKYIAVPTSGYIVNRDYAVNDMTRMRGADYVITKTLAYDIYANPERWKVYKDNEVAVKARRLYETLEQGRLPEFERVAVLSLSGRADVHDAVVVYKNHAVKPLPVTGVLGFPPLEPPPGLPGFDVEAHLKAYLEAGGKIPPEIVEAYKRGHLDEKILALLTSAAPSPTHSEARKRDTPVPPRESAP